MVLGKVSELNYEIISNDKKQIVHVNRQKNATTLVSGTLGKPRKGSQKGKRNAETRAKVRKKKLE